jgi:hypothetical protein
MHSGKHPSSRKQVSSRDLIAMNRDGQIKVIKTTLFCERVVFI